MLFRRWSLVHSTRLPRFRRNGAMTVEACHKTWTDGFTYGTWYVIRTPQPESNTADMTLHNWNRGQKRVLDPVNPRVLESFTAVPGGGNDMTVNSCLTAAQASNAMYADMENANECWSGNLTRGQLNALSKCNKGCNGNKTETYRGLSRLSIYQNVTPSVKWLPLGCYTTSSDAQTLSIPATAAARTMSSRLRAADWFVLPKHTNALVLLVAVHASVIMASKLQVF